MQRCVKLTLVLGIYNFADTAKCVTEIGSAVWTKIRGLYLVAAEMIVLSLFQFKKKGHSTTNNLTMVRTHLPTTACT